MRWLSLRVYGLVTSALFGAATPPVAIRARFERYSRASRESIRRTTRLGHRFRAEVFVPDYRLAPEHPHPAALDDALKAWACVRGLRPKVPMLVAGDSAGGGLSLSLLVKLRDLGWAMPDGAILLSPWTDLTASGASVDRNRGKDLWFTRRHLETWAGHYAPPAALRSPYVSPVFAEFWGLPPLLLLAAEDKLLLDDALRVREAAGAAGTDVRVHVGRGMQHDWPLTLPWLDESRLAWRVMESFVEERTARPHERRGEPPRAARPLAGAPRVACLREYVSNSSTGSTAGPSRHVGPFRHRQILLRDLFFAGT